MEAIKENAKQIKTIGVLTSGGDAPGMNACVRAIVRTALDQGIRVIGIQRGYAGLLKRDTIEMTATTVSNIIHRGGTMLYTARCDEFVKPEAQDRGAAICGELGIDAIITIGGDGTFRGAQKLAERGINVVGIPATIDGDIACSEYTIGFDTALNIACEAVNRLRDTSASHARCNVVEVMGRNCGELAMWTGLATGADVVMLPEDEKTQDFDAMIKILCENRDKGKDHNIVVVAEGVGHVSELAKRIEAATGIESRATVLGHIQRGGAPTALDIKHSSMMGYLAVNTLIAGGNQRVIVVRNGAYMDIDMEEAFSMKRQAKFDLLNANKVISEY